MIVIYQDCIQNAGLAISKIRVMNIYTHIHQLTSVHNRFIYVAMMKLMSSFRLTVRTVDCTSHVFPVSAGGGVHTHLDSSLLEAARLITAAQHGHAAALNTGH